MKTPAEILREHITRRETDRLPHHEREDQGAVNALKHALKCIEAIVPAYEATVRAEARHAWDSWTDKERAVKTGPLVFSAAELRMQKCHHGVTFEDAAATDLSVEEIRKRWPRLHGVCPLGCGFDGIAYASTAHFVMGDW